MTENIIYRKVLPGDEHEVGIVASNSWHYAYQEIFDFDYIEDWLNANYSEETLAKHIREVCNNDSYIFFVTLAKSSIIGFSESKIVAKGGELLRIYLEPKCIGKGIGNAP